MAATRRRRRTANPSKGGMGGIVGLLVLAGAGYYAYSSGMLGSLGVPIPGLPGGGGGGSCTGSAAAMTGANANFMSQMVGWQQERKANGENPKDWDACRGHLRAIGAPDPGPSGPPEFCAFA